MEHRAISEARSYIELALCGLGTLDIGPLDYNVTTTADYLRTAAALLEQYKQDRK